jgi:hypothetical protein
MRVFIIGKPIQEEGLYVYNLHDIAEEHFSISIASLRLSWCPGQNKESLSFLHGCRKRRPKDT